jgi:predicted nucleotidyltransferase
LDELLADGGPAVLFSTVAGSHAYGTAHEQSDRDLRGVFALPAQRYLDLVEPPRQIADERNNTIYYALRRFVELATNANPSILELLYMPADCVLRCEPPMRLVQRQRDLFITRRAYDSHVEYASAQIARARGRNKWVNNPQPPDPPTREAFCWVIPRDERATPYRPVPLAKSGIDLTSCRVAALEHTPDVYRLYLYADDGGRGEKGVFRGETGGQIVCASIPLEDEATRCVGLLIYNRTAHEQAARDHKNYWQWRAARNPTRWTSQEQGERDFDAKNMMHTLRLLLSGEWILRHGEPLVRVTGDHLAFLRAILAGQHAYDTLIELADARVQALAELRDRSTLPDHPDGARVAGVLQEATAMFEDLWRRSHGHG